MRLSPKFSFKILFFFGLSFFIFSCSSTTNINQAFEEKYGKEVEKIKAERTPSKELQNEVVTITQNQIETAWQGVEDSGAQNAEYYAYIDISKGVHMPQAYSPDGQAYEKGQANNPANSLPQNMFEVTYNTALYPPFRRAGAEFDRIEIPEVDAFGRKTEMSEKNYLLVGNKSLQKNIDKINSSRSAESIEMSEILIKEQKQLKRKQKIIKIFGEDSLELAALENNQTKTSAKSSTKSSSAEIGILHAAANLVESAKKKLE